jgi:hypothetical protein
LDSTCVSSAVLSLFNVLQMLPDLCNSYILEHPAQVTLCMSQHSIHMVNYIQGDSGGICTTLGNDSMSDSKQKSSYEHVSDFERLRSYGHFLIPVHALM